MLREMPRAVDSIDKMTAIPTEIIDFLVEGELIRPDETPVARRLTGGISCDIWHIRGARAEFCVKRAMPQLNTADAWHVSPDRSQSEVNWLRRAGRIIPDSVPEVLADDPERNCFALAYLDPEKYSNWKQQLLDGSLSVQTAETAAGAIAKVHRETAGNPSVARLFDNATLFHDLRIEPYLLTAAARNPEIASRIQALAAELGAKRVALIHGDFSPKNILVTDGGVMILDAEVACYGDPAFDMAFLLKHLLLKSVWRPAQKEQFGDLFTTAAQSYLDGVTWEDRDGLELRIAQLVPALVLGRIDGKSRIEYITDEPTRSAIRDWTIDHLKTPDTSLEALIASWLRAPVFNLNAEAE